MYITNRPGCSESYTNTPKSIWLLTATGQLWSIANINDISASANATHFATHGKKKKNGRNMVNIMLVTKLHATVATCKLYNRSAHQEMFSQPYKLFNSDSKHSPSPTTRKGVKHTIAFVLNREVKKKQYAGTNSQTEKQLSNKRKMMGSLTWPGF